jgi:hypothetical protein
VGVPVKPQTVNVKRIRTPTQSRGRGTRLGDGVLFSLKEHYSPIRKSHPSNVVTKSAPNASDGVRYPARVGGRNNRSTAARAVVTVKL